MGLDNRDYMRKEPDSFGSVRGYEIRALTLLIAVNVAVWLVWQFAVHNGPLSEFMTRNFMCSIDNAFTHLRLHTLVTSAISHIGAQHILFNMLFFWFLGEDVEIFYGRRNLLALYVFAGATAALAQCGLNYFTGFDIPMLGASGAVMGVAVAAAFIDPQKPMLLMGFVPMKLWLLVVLYIGMDLSGVMSSGNGGIAHAAHLGGAFAGLLFHKFDLRMFKAAGKFRVIEGGIARLTTERQRDELHESWNRPPANPAIDAESARRVDELLAKISNAGMSALNDEERAFLKRTSEKYKRPANDE